MGGGRRVGDDGATGPGSGGRPSVDPELMISMLLTFSDANARINHSRIERLAIWETQDPEHPADLPDAGESATILRVPLS